MQQHQQTHHHGALHDAARIAHGTYAALSKRVRKAEHALSVLRGKCARAKLAHDAAYRASEAARVGWRIAQLTGTRGQYVINTGNFTAAELWPSADGGAAPPPVLPSNVLTTTFRVHWTEGVMERSNPLNEGTLVSMGSVDVCDLPPGFGDELRESICARVSALPKQFPWLVPVHDSDVYWFSSHAECYGDWDGNTTLTLYYDANAPEYWNLTSESELRSEEASDSDDSSFSP